MTLKVVRTERYVSELRELHLWLHDRNPSAADAVARDIEAKVAALAATPGVGVPRPDLGPGYRMVIRHPYLVFYVVDEPAAVVKVVSVLHGARNLPVLLP